MDFQDFPMILGTLGVETDHPPKMCAGLRPTTPAGIPRARFHRLDPSCTKLASLLQESYGIYNRWSNSLTDSMQAQSKFGEDQEPYK